MKALNKRGFSAIEIIILILILAVSAYISLPKIISIINESKKDDFLLDIETLEESFENNLIHNIDELSIISAFDLDKLIEEQKVYDNNGKITHYIDTVFHMIEDEFKDKKTKGDFLIDIKGKVLYISEKEIEKEKYISNELCSLLEIEGNSLYKTKDNGDGTITIVKYLGDEKNVVIPYKIDGKVVSRIEANIDIDDISNNKDKYYNSKEERIKDTWEDIDYGFYDKEIESVVLPCSIKEIGPFSFGNNKIKGLTVPNGLEVIGDYSFYLNDIENLRLGKSVKEIGREAFSNNSLGYVKILSNVNLKEGAFFKNNISKLDLAGGIINIGNRDDKIGIFEDNKLEELILPASLKVIGKSVFKKNLISKLDINNSLDLIGEYAFSSNKLKEIDLNLNGSVVDNYAFSNNELESISLKTSNSNSQIKNYAFGGNRLNNVSSIESVKINGIEYIDSIDKFGNVSNGVGIKINPLHGISIGNFIFKAN